MRYAWGKYVVPFVYADQLGPGGATQARHAVKMGMQLGQIDPADFPGGVEGECPPGWPEGVPCMLPGSTPGAPMVPIITEEEAAKREVAAFEKGRRSEQGSVVKTAAISAAVSAVVGIAIGKFLS